MEREELTVEEMLNTRGFLAHLVRYADRLDFTDPRNKKTIGDRFYAFKGVNRMASILMRVLGDKVAKSTEVVLGPEDLRPAVAHLEKEVITNPESVVRLLGKAEMLSHLPAQISYLKEEYEEMGGSEAHMKAREDSRQRKEALKEHRHTKWYKFSTWWFIGALCVGTREKTRELMEELKGFVDEWKAFHKLRSQRKSCESEQRKIEKEIFAVHEIIDPIVSIVQKKVAANLAELTADGEDESIENLEKAHEYLVKVLSASIEADWTEKVSDLAQLEADLQKWIRHRQYLAFYWQIKRIPAGTQGAYDRVMGVLKKGYLARKRTCGRSDGVALDIVVEAAERVLALPPGPIRDEHKYVLEFNADANRFAQFLDKMRS